MTPPLLLPGLPEAVARTDPRRRGRFHDSYMQNLIDRDVRQLSVIERAPQLTALIRLLATRSGHIVPRQPGIRTADIPACVSVVRAGEVALGLAGTS